jgi:hypothetical protein
MVALEERTEAAKVGLRLFDQQARPSQAKTVAA